MIGAVGAGEAVEPGRSCDGRVGLEYHRPVMSRFEGRFEGQADGFDRRAGLPPEPAARVAEAVAEAAAPFLDRSDRSVRGILLEIGAGTGVIGADLAGQVPRYLGLDLSGAMLRRFRRKLVEAAEPAPGRTRAEARALLARADADAGWPVADGGESPVGALFLSRAAHLLEPEHLVEECLRVADPRGAVLILGGVRREPGSVRDRMRRQMRRLLAEQGLEGRSRERAHELVAALVEARLGRVEREAPRAVAAWERDERPADSLAVWRSKPGLAGREVTPQVQSEVLDRLEAWARGTWKDLHRAHTTTERYELTVFPLPAR